MLTREFRTALQIAIYFNSGIIDSMKILIMGASGSGKSTLGERLAGKLRWGWVDTGAIFRESKEPWVIEQLKTAQLFDDEMTAGLVIPRLVEVPNVVFTGFPRNLKQAEILVEKQCVPEMIIEVAVPREEISQRLAARGREQDAPEIVEERLAMYAESRGEILAVLIGNGARLVSVDGTGTPDEVLSRTIGAISAANAGTGVTKA